MPHRPYGCRHEAKAPLGPMAPDLTRSTTFAYPTAETVRAVGLGEAEGEFYARYGSALCRRFESQVAELEGADGAVAFASGLGAIHAVFGGLLSAGDVLACSRDVYGGVSAQATHDLPRFGFEVRRFDPFDPADLDRALTGGARLVHVETPTNPLCRVVDLGRVVAQAKAAGALVSVDATFAPPPLQRVLGDGADLAVHSATKFLGGHSDVLAGVVSASHELCERLEGWRRRTGAVLSPDSAWLLCRSMPTLELRVRAAEANAGRLAAFLSGRGIKVHYPGLANHPDHEVAARRQAGYGSMLAFEVAGGLAGAAAVMDRFEVIARAVSLGAVHSLASLPLHTSHAMMSAEDRHRAGIADGLVRLSVGIEPYEVLEADLARALGAQ